MREKIQNRRMKVLKRAASCALTLVFLLSACGMSENKSSDSASTQSAYTEEAEGAYEAYEEGSRDAYAAYSEDSEYSYTEADESVAMAEPAPAESAAATAEDSGEDAKTAEGTGTEGSAGTAGDENSQSSNRKIVYTGNISLQTLEYDKSSQSIHDRINACGGFIENEDTSNEDPYWYYRERSGATANRTRRYLNITARIPAEQFDSFMKQLGEDGQVINTSVSARNISVSYATHDASRKALEIEQERLLEMMDKAETIEDMIAVEERLTQVERELGNEKTTLSAMDRDVNFSTVFIRLEEVFEYTESVVEISYGERLQKAFGRAIDGFVTFWEELILFVVETFPFLIMLAIIIFVIVKLVRRSRRRKMERMAAMEEARRAAAAAGVPGAAYTAYPGAAAANTAASGTARRRGFFRRGKKNENPVPAAPVPPAPGTGSPAPQAPGTGGSVPPAPGTGNPLPPASGTGSPVSPASGTGPAIPPASAEGEASPEQDIKN